MDATTFLTRCASVKPSLWEKFRMGRSGRPECQSRLVLGDTHVTRQKILVIDDDQVILKALSLKLSAAGFEVVTAADGSDAISAMRDSKPDLILLDLNFPPDISHPGGIAWDGFRLLSWLRQVDARGIPVIVITAGEPANYRNAVLAAGAVGFFQKPFPPTELLGAIERALKNEGLKPAARFRPDFGF